MISWPKPESKQQLSWLFSYFDLTSQQTGKLPMRRLKQNNFSASAHPKMLFNRRISVFIFVEQYRRPKSIFVSDAGLIPYTIQYLEVGRKRELAQPSGLTIRKDGVSVSIFHPLPSHHQGRSTEWAGPSYSGILIRPFWSRPRAATLPMECSPVEPNICIRIFTILQD